MAAGLMQTQSHAQIRMEHAQNRFGRADKNSVISGQAWWKGSNVHKSISTSLLML